VQEILRATSEVIAEHGYLMASLDEIAHRLDVTKASLYYYFPSKDDLIVTCLELVAEDIIARLEDTAARPFPSQRERLSALILVQMEGVVIEHPHLAGFFLHPPDLPKALQARTKDLRRRHDKAFRGVVEAGMDAGEFRPAQLAVAMNNFYGAINFAPQWLVTRPRRRFHEQVAQMADNLLLLFMDVASDVQPSIDLSGRGEVVAGS
jgi:AcrR family transcriptional regulator